MAAIEIPVLGLWLGALCGFAFIFAPAAFRLVPDVARFAALTAENLDRLSLAGYLAGAVTIVAAALRSIDAADRTNDIIRIVLVLLALALVAYQQVAIIPAMAAIPDVQGPAYHALHQRSTIVYGAVLLLGLVALVMAAVRGE